MHSIKLGNIELKSNVILAPMAGVTDMPFRNIVRKFGNFLMYSEMIASQAVIRNVKRTKMMMDSNNDPYTAIQLVGADPRVMAEAAKLSYDLGARIIDINMGCPVKKVVKTYAGSALMKDISLATKIIKEVIDAVPIPVTLKMRLGWDDNNINASELAHIAEDLGIQMITVHGRTRSQLYSGQANWLKIREVKESVNIPVIANGDIIDTNSTDEALKQSKADGVMIGRGALGSPWILKQIHNHLENNKSTEVIDKYSISKEHIEAILSYYPEQIALTLAKKVIIYYCKSCKNASKFRAIMSDSNIKDTPILFEILHNIFC